MTFPLFIQRAPLAAILAGLLFWSAALAATLLRWLLAGAHTLPTCSASCLLHLRTLNVFPSVRTASGCAILARSFRLKNAKFITVKPRQVAIISNRTPLRTGKRKEISCETTGSRPPADVHWKLVRPGNEEKLTDFRLVLLKRFSLFKLDLTVCAPSLSTVQLCEKAQSGRRTVLTVK